MDGIFYIVIFAAVGLILLLIMDKRKSIVAFLKEKVFKPRPIKVPKVKDEPEKTKEKEPESTGKLGYGDFSKVPIEEEKPQVKPKFFDNNLFGDNDDIDFEEDDDDMDIEKILKDIEAQESSQLNKKFQSDSLDQQLPDFENMSLSDLNSLLESSLEGDYNVDFGQFGAMDDDLSGEELGEIIKKLPRPIKVLIASDILKKKF